MTSIRQQREDARQAAWYARVGLRRRLEERTLPVESKSDRWRREAEEQAAREADEHAERKTREQRGIDQLRQHEIRLAKANNNNVVDADVLAAIGDALNALVARVEALEARVGINGDKLGTEAVELPRFLSPKFGTSLGWPEDVRFSQPLMTKRNAK